LGLHPTNDRYQQSAWMPPRETVAPLLTLVTPVVVIDFGLIV
jgi:hypothetical protein